MKSNTWKHSKSSVTVALMTVALLVMAAIPALAHQANTQSAIAFSPSSPVNAGTLVTITGTVTYTGTFGGGPPNGHTVITGGPVAGENLQIQVALDADGNHVACADAVSFATTAQGSTNSSGQFSTTFDTTGLGGQTLGFRSHHPAGTGAGPGHSSGQSASDCADLVIIDEPEGCSHGFWKNHDGSGPQANEWPEPYTPTTSLGSIYTIPSEFGGLGSFSFGAALEFTGGPTLLDAAKILLRNAVASVLNAAHPEVAYPMTVQEVRDAVNAALASLDRQTMLDLEKELNELNKLGAPGFCTEGGEN